MKKIAVEGMTFKFVETGYSFSAASVITLPSEYIKSDGKKAYCGKITVSVTGIKYGAYSGVGSFDLNPSSINKSNGKNLLLEGDSSDPVQVTLYASATPPSIVANLTLKVDSSGQDFIKSD